MFYPEELTKTYDIYEQIGKGGAGTVYRAMHKRLQKSVVLKKITGNATSIQECRTEVDILKNLRHSYLPQVLDFIESAEGIYTVIDYIPGKSLRQLLDEGHTFTEKAVLKYTKQLCEALSYLHTQNPPIVHGDIKPDNIMITPEDNVCLIDFNISGILAGQGAQTLGYTPGYSAPEQVEAFNRICLEMHPQGDTSQTIMLSKGDNSATVLLKNNEMKGAEKTPISASNEDGKKYINIDKRADIYSLGATMYTLLTGKIWDYEATKHTVPQVSDGFLTVLSKSLERNPEKRYLDAEKMLRAVTQVRKKDKRYRRLLWKQELISILIILFMAFSALLTTEGNRKLAKEKEEYYYQLVEEMDAAQEMDLDVTQFEERYNAAIGMYPKNIRAYYSKAIYLFYQGDYEETIRYIEESLQKNLEGEAVIHSNLYHVYAECYFNLEDYESAKVYYQTALKYYDKNPVIYRDYAISLVYLNRVEEAEMLLTQAIEKGMVQTDVCMVQGEIERLTQNYEEALNYFEKVASLTEDEYLLQRVYVMGSKAHSDMGGAEALQKDILWLQSGINRLKMSNRLLLYERLAQDYITLGELSQDNTHYQSAVDVLDEIRKMNWATAVTYNNAIILCQRMDNLNSAEQWAQEMVSKYPEDYTSYLRYAYLEIEKQSNRQSAERDYTVFETYYVKAKECYKRQVSGNVTNAEIQLLDNVYKQVVDGGWLE